MNFHKLILRNPIVFIVILIFNLVFISSTKYWWAIVINLIITCYLLVDKYPRIGNHSTIILFICAALLVIFILKLLNFKLLLNSAFLPYLFRITLVSTYFYSGFHKLNSDFFNSCVSCVNDINEYNLSHFTNSKIVLSQQWSRFFQFATLVTEMILPFGLFHHKTRKFTALALLLFHFYLSFSVFSDFSALALFLIIGCIHNFDLKEIPKCNLKALKIYLIFSILAIFGKKMMLIAQIDRHNIDFYQGLVFNFGFLFFVISYFKTYIEKRYEYNRSYNLKLTLVLMIVSVWSLKGYVGLGNAGNLTMFSNLVTEKSRSNHLLIDTKKTKIFDFEEDYVYIMAIDVPILNKEYKGFYLPKVEFNFLVNYWGAKLNRAIYSKLLYRNKVYEIKDLRKSEFNHSKWWYRYLFFRKIQANAPNKCRW